MAIQKLIVNTYDPTGNSNYTQAIIVVDIIRIYDSAKVLEIDYAIYANSTARDIKVPLKVETLTINEDTTPSFSDIMQATLSGLSGISLASSIRDCIKTVIYVKLSSTPRFKDGIQVQ